MKERTARLRAEERAVSGEGDASSILPITLRRALGRGGTDPPHHDRLQRLMRLRRRTVLVGEMRLIEFTPMLD